jgi:hypothetical protein
MNGENAAWSDESAFAVHAANPAAGRNRLAGGGLAAYSASIDNAAPH